MPSTEDKIKLKFTGEDTTIDATLLAQTILDLNTLSNIAAKQIDPEAKTGLILTETKPGCFEAYFSTIATVGASLLSPEGLNTIGAIIEYLRFIIQLGKKQPESVSVNNSNGNVTVINGDGNTININRNTYNIYVDPNARKATTDLWKSLYKSSRQGDLSISATNEDQEQSDQNTVTIEKSYGNNFPDVVFEPKQNSIESEMVINAFLPIRRPDLAKDGPWVMEYQQSNVWMKIEDEQFMEKVKSGTISFKSGDSLLCQLRIKYVEDPDGNPVVGSEKYSIKKVLKQVPRAENVDMFDQAD
ncbi:MAG: hypothetical protein IJL05_03845 [Alphaproteobacteria bacterium]|nr:hypothetical protein [Alphaproteobacteria bacterium]